MCPKAVKVKTLENYILQIEFSNGEVKYFDVKPYLNHKAFMELKNKSKFNTVKISGLSVAWVNGADICPDELYNNSYLNK